MMYSICLSMIVLLSIVLLRSIHIVTNEKFHYFSWMSSILYYTYTQHLLYLFIYQWIFRLHLSYYSERGEWKGWLKAPHSENEDHGIWSNHFMGNSWGNGGNSQTLFFWAPKSLQMVTAAMKLKDPYSLEGKLWPT